MMLRPIKSFAQPPQVPIRQSEIRESKQVAKGDRKLLYVNRVRYYPRHFIKRWTEIVAIDLDTVNPTTLRFE